MSKNSRRSQRRAEPKTIPSISGDGRNTFRTAAARRRLVEDLKPLSAFALRDAPLRDTPVRESPNGDRRAATTSPAPSRDRNPEPRPESLTLNDAQGEKRQEERCKRTPPPSNKGNGGSRRFVPWDRKC